MLAFFIFVSLVLPLQSYSQDEGAWLYKLVSSLRNRGGSNQIISSSYQPIKNFYWENLTRTPTQNQGFSKLPSSTGTNVGKNDKRFGFGGLLCCNHPPTRPPTTKRANTLDSTDDSLRSLLLSNVMQSFAEYVEAKPPGYNADLEPSLTDLWTDFGQAADIGEVETESGLWYPQNDNKEDSYPSIDRRQVTEQRIKKRRTSGAQQGSETF